MPVRYVLPLLLMALTTLLAARPATAQTFFTAHLTPTQAGTEAESASGTAALALTDEGLRFIVTVDGLSGPITNAHFHAGAPGESGGVVRGILDDFTGHTAIGLWRPSDAQPLDEAAMTALLQGRLYLNIHTAAHPGGEIRGQVVPSAGTALSAALTTAQAGVEGTAGGTAAMHLTDAGLIYLVTVADLTGPVANAHFHRGAFGESGGVVRGIADTFDGNTAFGLWRPTDATEPLTDEAVADLLLGNLYLNIHTAAHPGGEIRGQVLLSGGWGFSARLDGEQAGTGVGATGTAAMTLTPHGLVYRLTVDGLSGPITNAHFHEGAAGESGGVAHGIFDAFDGTTAAGLWRPTDAQPLTPDRIADLVQGRLYLNIHTAAHPGGEIRGQVLPNEGTSLTATLTTTQAGVDGTGLGTATMTLGDDGLAYQVTVSGLTGAVMNAHFHRGAAGESGGVVREIFDTFTGNTASGTWGFADATEPLTDEAIADLLLGRLYLNVHTAAHPGGEIRGQVVPSSGTGLQARLTPAQAGTESTGSGTAAMTLTPHGLIYRLTVADLSADVANAHFHQGAFGVSGGVVRGIFDTFDGATATGLWRPTDATEPLTAEAIADLLLGRLYLNVHTAAHPGGEIRGQVLASDGFGVAMDLSPDQEVHDVVSDGRGTAALTFSEAGIRYGLTVADLTSAVTNAHVHRGAAGENGGVVRGIFDTFDGATATGLWRPTDATEPLTTDAVTDFLQGRLYLNVHTTDYGAGEVRGQIRPQAVVVTDVADPAGEVPERFALAQNYPNPFNPATTIAFTLPHTAHVSLAVFDVLGRRVATLVDRPMASGLHRVSFDAAGLPGGLYLYRLDAGPFQETRSMVLLK